MILRAGTERDHFCRLPAPLQGRCYPRRDAIGRRDERRVGPADIVALRDAAARVAEQFGDRRVAVALVGGDAADGAPQVV